MTSLEQVITKIKELDETSVRHFSPEAREVAKMFHELTVDEAIVAHSHLQKAPLEILFAIHPYLEHLVVCIHGGEGEPHVCSWELSLACYERFWGANRERNKQEFPIFGSNLYARVRR